MEIDLALALKWNYLASFAFFAVNYYDHAA